MIRRVLSLALGFSMMYSCHAAFVPVTGGATPKVVALEYTNASNPNFSNASLLASFPLVIMNFTRSFTKDVFGSSPGTYYSQTQTYLNQIRSRNPNIVLLQYVDLMDLELPKAGTDIYPLALQVQNNDAAGAGWWARDASTGRLAQYDSNYPNSYMPNITSKASPVGGKLFPQVHADFDWNYYLTSLPQINGIFIDDTTEHAMKLLGNTTHVPDYLRAGVNPLVGDKTTDDAVRQGFLDYVKAHKSHNAALNVVVNAIGQRPATASDVNSLSLYKGLFTGGFMEAVIGRPYSFGTWGNESVYRQAIITPYNTLVGNVTRFAILNANSASTDYKSMRWGLASALMGDGYFCYTAQDADAVKHAKWYDEYSVQIGDPIDPIQTAPRSNGLWYRRYSNAIVISNPTGAPQSLDLTSLGGPYYRINAAALENQDPSINSGQAVGNIVTVPSKDGLILVKNQSFKSF